MVKKFSRLRVLVKLSKKNISMVMPFITKALESADPLLQETALYELLQIISSLPDPLSKQHTRCLINFFDHILTIQDSHLQQLVFPEIAALYKTYPPLFSPLIRKALDHNNPYLQWNAALLLAHKFFSGEAFPKPDFQAQPFFNINSPNIALSLRLITTALNSNNDNLAWQALLELIDLAKLFPQKTIPLLKECLNHQNPHIQWLASLTLLNMSAFPSLFIQNSPSQELNKINRIRILVELGKHEPKPVFSLLRIATHSSNAALRLAARREYDALRIILS